MFWHLILTQFGSFSLHQHYRNWQWSWHQILNTMFCFSLDVLTRDNKTPTMMMSWISQQSFCFSLDVLTRDNKTPTMMMSWISQQSFCFSRDVLTRDNKTPTMMMSWISQQSFCFSPDSLARDNKMLITMMSTTCDWGSLFMIWELYYYRKVGCNRVVLPSRFICQQYMYVCVWQEQVSQCAPRSVRCLKRFVVLTNGYLCVPQTVWDV